MERVLSLYSGQLSWVASNAGDLVLGTVPAVAELERDANTVGRELDVEDLVESEEGLGDVASRGAELDALAVGDGVARQNGASADPVGSGGAQLRVDLEPSSVGVA